MRASSSSARSRAATGGDSGSVFVESIIAAAIVAMSLAGTLRVISDNAMRDRAAEARRAALLVAQSELANVGSEIPLEPGDNAGVSGDMVWRVGITPYDADQSTSAVGDLLEVTVAVEPRAGGRPLVTLRSLRLGGRT